MPADQNTPSDDTVEDFNSVSLVIDHLSLRDTDDFTVKFNMSSQPVETALLALMVYYNEGHLMASPRGVAVVQRAAQEVEGFYVYETPNNVQVIADGDTWNKMVHDERLGGGSMMAASRILHRLVLNGVLNQGTNFPLHFMSFAAGKADVETEEPLMTRAQWEASTSHID